MGEVAVTAAIDFGCASTWMAFASLMGWVEEVTPAKIFLTFVVIIVAHALLNTFGVKLVGLLSNISAWWHVVGVLIIVAVLWILPEKHQSVSWTLTGFHNETGWTFLPYVFLMGLLMAQYTFTGYDASAHVSEETKNASRAAPRGIVMSVLVSLIGGFILLYSITAAIPDGSEEGLTTLAASETGLPPAQIFLDSLGPDVAKFLLFIVCVAQFLCGMASVTANSRMTYAFSRDNALPGSRIWAKVNPQDRHPDQLDLAVRGAVDHPGLAGADLLGRLPRRHLDRGDRALHRVRGAGLPAPAQPRLPARAVEPGPVERADRLDRRGLGGLHLHPVRAAAGLPGHRAAPSTTRRSP